MGAVRTLPIIAGVAVIGVLATGGGLTAVSVSRSADFQRQAASLEQTWASDQAGGLPATVIAPMKSQLAAAQNHPWYSPWWIEGSGSPIIQSLSSQTTSAWNAAMADARARATAAGQAWQSYDDSSAKYLPAASVTNADAWQASLTSATTPAALDALTRKWQVALTTDQAAAAAEQQRELQAARAAVLAQYQGLLDQSQRDATVAANDSLDAGQVPDLLAQLNSEIANGQDAAATAAQLTAADSVLEQTINLNNTIAGNMRPVLWVVDQAVAEGTPNAGSFQNTYNGVVASFKTAATADQLNAVQQQLTALQSQMQAELSANQCGHSVGGGKVITVNLTLQEAVFYQDGCVVNATPVTTGRPGLATPAGNFHVFYKTAPFEMVSPWPRGSAYYYNPTWVKWVLEFDSGGYFLHDAYWEPAGDYGPGSEYNVADDAASHGCIHIPTPMMQWLYGWADVGTPVNITQ